MFVLFQTIWHQVETTEILTTTGILFMAFRIWAVIISVMEYTAQKSVWMNMSRCWCLFGLLHVTLATTEIPMYACMYISTPNAHLSH